MTALFALFAIIMIFLLMATVVRLGSIEDQGRRIIKVLRNLPSNLHRWTSVERDGVAEPSLCATCATERVGFAIGMLCACKKKLTTNELACCAACAKQRGVCQWCGEGLAMAPKPPAKEPPDPAGGYR